MSLDDGFERPFEEFEPPQWGALRELCGASVDYFSSHQDEGSLRIRGALMLMLDTLNILSPMYKEIAKVAPLYDFDRNTPGNGFRSFLMLVDKSIIHSAAVCRETYRQKDSVLFWKTSHMKEVESCSQLLASLSTCLQYLQVYLRNESENDGARSLFSTQEHSVQELLDQAENINQYCFYGRCGGFQFCDSMKIVIKTIMLAMASFSEIYYDNVGIIGRCTNSMQYLMDPDMRARRIVTISQNADISFCKAFWKLNESNIVFDVPSMVMPSLAINHIISIPPEDMNFSTTEGLPVNIPVPISHIGKKPIHVRLLSSKRRIGMVGSGSVKGPLEDQCEGLVIHCHGGGFVAQSSRSHEVYLRYWAIELDVPILSIDYSLAPAAPFPRALEEVLYAYIWALNHASTLLGTTARKVVFAGDSAGANLNLATTLRCIELNIRKPDGIFMAYTPVLVEFVPSASRLLCLSDPILPFGFMMRCLKAYADIPWVKKQDDNMDDSNQSDTESFAEVSESDLIALALSANGDETNEGQKLPSLPSDSTLNSVSLSDADIAQDEVFGEESKSREYINRFMEMYRNSKFSSSISILNGSKYRESHGTNNSQSWSLFGWKFGRSYDKEPRLLNTELGKSSVEEFAFTVPKNPFLSPYRATNEDLAKMPPVSVLTTDLDPCLDDCVMFAKRLKSVGNPVKLDILNGLPHGFLNLSLVSKDAFEGSQLSGRRIKELLQS